MSDGLTRYRVRPMLDPDHPWAPSAEIVDDPKGGLVKAEEAEARIKELEEALDDQRKGWDESMAAVEAETLAKVRETERTA